MANANNHCFLIVAIQVLRGLPKLFNRLIRYPSAIKAKPDKGGTHPSEPAVDLVLPVVDDVVVRVVWEREPALCLEV